MLGTTVTLTDESLPVYNPNIETDYGTTEHIGTFF